MRRLLLEAVRTVQDGSAPRGSAPSDHRNARAFDDIVDPATPFEKLLQETVAKW